MWRLRNYRISGWDRTSEIITSPAISPTGYLWVSIEKGFLDRVSLWICAYYINFLEFHNAHFKSSKSHRKETYLILIKYFRNSFDCKTIPLATYWRAGKHLDFAKYSLEVLCLIIPMGFLVPQPTRTPRNCPALVFTIMRHLLDCLCRLIKL